MDRDDAKKLLDAQTLAGDISFSPGASNLVSQLLSPPQPPPPMQRPSVAASERQFQEENVDPGTTLDVTTGASPWERLMLEARNSRDSQINYLENKYPGKVRMSKTGELIFRVPDQENKGQEKDILAIPHGKLTLSDFINLSAAMPEVAGWIAAERGATQLFPRLAGRGVLPAAGRLAAGAAGAETTGALTKDIPLSLYDQGNADLGQIAKTRAGQAAGDVAVGGAANALGSAIRFLNAPLAGQRGPMQLNALDARQALKEKYGIEVPFSIGESTGVPLFMRSEAFVEKEPGGSGPIKTLKGKQEESLRSLQQLMMGNRPVREEEVGKKAIEEIQNKIGPVVAEEGAKREALTSTANDALQGIVSGLTHPDRQLFKESLGNDIRQAVIDKRDQMKAEADRLYQNVRDLPGGTGKVFNGAPLQQKFEDILSKLPSMEVQKPTGLFEPTGRPITGPAQETLEKWPPDKLLARLREITSARNPKFALSDLQQMRRDIYDDIQAGEGVPGLGTRYLSQIGSAITDFINESIAKLPDADPLKNALKAADKHYREQVVPFNRPGLNELFKKDEPGAIPDDQVLNRMLGTGGNVRRNWNLIKETVGENTPTFQKLRRAVADNLTPRLGLNNETIDAKKFLQNLYSFRTDQPEIYQEVFSPKEQELFRQARALQYAQGDTIDAKDLQDLLNSPHPTGPQFRALVDAEKKKNDLYRNDIIKAIGDGKVDETTLKPTEFVNRLLADKSFGLEDTKQLMGLIQGNPQLEQELRQKALERVFREAARPAKAQDITRTAAGDNTHILSGVKLNEAIKDRNYAVKLKEILGPDSYDDLQNYINLTAPLEQKEEAYRLAGGLAAGSRIGQLERVLEGRGGLLRFANNTLRSFVFSYMLSNPVTRGYLSRTADNLPAAKNVMVSVFTSPPFIEAVAKQFPGVTGARFVNELRNSVEQSVKGEQPKTQQPRDTGVRQMTDEEKRQWFRQQMSQP